MNKNSGTVTDTNIFAGSAKIVDQGGTYSGGLLYTEGNLVFDGNTSGNNYFGTEANPVLMLVGGNMDMEKMLGTTEIYGLVFVDGAILTSGTATGNYTISGAVIANSESQQSTFNSTGNPTLGFDHTILDLLSQRPALAGLVKQTACGGTFGRAAFISNSKVTVF
jgi:hypothetical protein